MSRRGLSSTLADWALPPEIYRLVTSFRVAELAFWLRQRPLLKANAALAGRHAGARCFILCNGPSVRTQDIRPLRGEVVFSVSSGYLHPAFAVVAPRYHCIPQLTYGSLTRDKAATWFREVDAALPPHTELFLASQEYDLVRQNDLFRGRTVHYLCMGRRYFPRRAARVPELSGIVPRVQSVPIMAMLVALSMGFKTIYLLGVEHDWFVTKRYDYFFDRSRLNWVDHGVEADGRITTTLLDDLPVIERLWAQYLAVRRIAEGCGVTICNLTPGGMLDVYQRGRLEDVMSPGSTAAPPR